MTIEDPIEFLHGHKKCIVNQREIGSDAQTFAARPEGRAAPGPRRDPRRRDARPGDDLDRADRGRDRPPRLRHPAHAERAADDRPHHRRLPAHQQDQVRVQLSVALQGVMTQQLLPDGRRLGPHRGLRGARADPGGPQPDPRGQDPPDPLGACRPARASACRRWTPPSPASSAPARSASALAEARSSTPEELRRLLGIGGVQRGLIAWPPTSSRRSTSPGRRPRARSTPTPSRSSPTS